MSLAKRTIASQLSSELSKVPHRVLTLTSDTYLYQEGEKADKLYLIVSGKIKLCKVTEDGRELTYRICTADNLLGEMTLFTDTNTQLLDAYVLTNSVVWEFNKATVEEYFFLHSNLAYEMMKAIGEHYKRTQLRYRDMVIYSKRGALISTIIRLSNSYGIKRPDGILINIALTNQELGNFCGISRESTNKILRSLKEEGILSNVKSKILIHDLKALMEEIEFDDRHNHFYTVQ